MISDLGSRISDLGSRIADLGLAIHRFGVAQPQSHPSTRGLTQGRLRHRVSQRIPQGFSLAPPSRLAPDFPRTGEDSLQNVGVLEFLAEDDF